MITFFEAALSHLSVHRVGNKQAGESLLLSEHPLQVADEALTELLMRYFIAPFENKQESFCFFHSSDNLSLNEVYHFVSAMFSSPDEFHEHSVSLARHLYDISNHPNIKTGELCVARFENLLVDGESKTAIGIFKSESKESYLTMVQDGDDFAINYEQQAINIKKVDKACLVIDEDKENGYRVMVIDNTNRSEAFYWVDQFLKVKARNDNFGKTNDVLKLYKDFVTKGLDEHYEHIEKADKIDMLNRSISYFKNRDQFEESEFMDEVIGDKKAIKLFNSYKENFEKEWDTRIDTTFDISTQAVRQQARHYKSVLKLDKNFHIYIHGNRDLIERGFDEEKNLSYYKVYFSNEQ